METVGDEENTIGHEENAIGLRDSESQQHVEVHQETAEVRDKPEDIELDSGTSKRTYDEVAPSGTDSEIKKQRQVVEAVEAQEPTAQTQENNLVVEASRDTLEVQEKSEDTKAITEDEKEEGSKQGNEDHLKGQGNEDPFEAQTNNEGTTNEPKLISTTIAEDLDRTTRENTDPALFSKPEEARAAASPPPTETNTDLRMIVSQLTEAVEEIASDESDNDAKKGKMVVLDGLEVPADSELLNTSKAFAAYSSFSNHLPSIPTVAGVVSGVHLAALPLPIVCPDYLPPRIQLLVNTLPTLDNLATQLLRIVVVGPYQKIIELASNQDTPAGATFRDLMSMFEITKKLYAEEDPFLTVEHVAPGMWKEGDPTPKIFRSREQSIESTLRKVNLATFLMATLGATEVGFFYLNESFLNIFCPFNSLDPGNAFANVDLDLNLQSGVNTIIGDKVGKMYRPQATLFLELKTQAYISAIEAGERSSEEILEEIFPSNLEEYLIYRRGVTHLSLVEEDFISRCHTRRQLLLSFPSERNLSEEYDWFAFLKELFNYVSKNMGFIILGKGGKNLKLRTSLTAQSQKLLNSVEGTTAKEKLEYLQKHNAFAPASSSSISLSALDKSRKRRKTDNDDSSGDIEISDKNNNSSNNNNNEPSNDGDNERNAVTDKYQNSGTEFNDKDVNDITKSLLPSEIKERQLHVRINPGITKTYSRQLWTREEEKALRDALELKGPAWSAILELFGKGGKINESLKNRNQVQLKDKARNMKVFFLKNMLPVPEYLQNVTGGLDREDKGKRSTRIKGTSKTAAAPVPNLTHNEQL